MTSTFRGWCILELMGHRQRMGYACEVEIAGSRLLQIDVLVGKDEADQDITITEFYGASAIYALRPCAEEIVRDQVNRYAEDPRPVRPLSYREHPGKPRLAEPRACEFDDEEERL